MKIDKLTNNITTYYTHGFHSYPAKFTPQIVNKYFNLFCKKGYKILDPFCGSGTSLVEAALNGMYSVGIDLNPIAALISRAKSYRYSSQQIESINNFKNELQFHTSGFLFEDWFENEKTKTKVPDFPNRTHWFQENISNELSVLKDQINKIDDIHIKDLLFCAFSRIIVKVSNQDSEVRYTAKDKNLPNGIVFSLFVESLNYYLNELKNDKYKIKSISEVYSDDTYIILQTFPDSIFDFIITSPPYINTFDYYLYHKQRMFWLDFDHRPIRKKEIGNHHRIDTKTLESAKLEYITSMTEIINELSRVAKNNTYFVMIIGDGIVDGHVIKMSNVIEKICEYANYTIEDIQSVNLSDITKSFNKKFSNAPKQEHTITLKNVKT